MRGGPVIAGAPPPRTGTAPLKHPGPTLDVGGEAYGLPHAVQAVGRALPARGPGRAVLFRVLLGPRPWLHELLRRSPGLVRSLHSYYGGVSPLLPLPHPLPPPPSPIPPPPPPPP